MFSTLILLRFFSGISTHLWIQVELQGVFCELDTFNSLWAFCECIFVMWVLISLAPWRLGCFSKATFWDGLRTLDVVYFGKEVATPR